MSTARDAPAEEPDAFGRDISDNRRRRRYLVLALVAVALAGGTGVMYLATRGKATASSASHTALPSSTAAITRGDVVDTEAVDGKLTYSFSRTVAAGGTGVVTQIPSEGAVFTRGQILYKVSNKPVVLMYGRLPLYRTLRAGGARGPDVRQLESNLKALGYGDGLSVDDRFTGTTTMAVKRWQQAVDLAKTGVVDASQVVFVPSPVRVSDVQASIGQPVGAGRTVLTLTGTKPLVHVDLDAAKQALARRGEPVSVDLPNGAHAHGHISTIGKVAKAHGSDPNNQTYTIDVDITLDEQATGGLDQTPVTVNMESARARNVLSVPIEALLGLREGGFGVEVVDGATSRIVPVRIGTFGAGRVEISGAGLTEGVRVGVPSP